MHTILENDRPAPTRTSHAPRDGSWRLTKKQARNVLCTPSSPYYLHFGVEQWNRHFALRHGARTPARFIRTQPAIAGVLQDWTEGLVCEVKDSDVIEELSRRKPNIPRVAFTEMPQHDRMSMSILTGKVSPSSENPTNDVPFHGLEVFTVKDAELSDGSIGQLFEDNQSLDSTSLVRTMGPPMPCWQSILPSPDVRFSGPQCEASS